MAIERANKIFMVLSAIFIFNLSKKQQQYKLDNQITKIDLYIQQQNWEYRRIPFGSTDTKHFNNTFNCPNSYSFALKMRRHCEPVNPDFNIISQQGKTFRPFPNFAVALMISFLFPPTFFGRSWPLIRDALQIPITLFINYLLSKQVVVSRRPISVCLLPT